MAVVSTVSHSSVTKRMDLKHLYALLATFPLCAITAADEEAPAPRKCAIYQNKVKYNPVLT